MTGKTLGQIAYDAYYSANTPGHHPVPWKEMPYPDPWHAAARGVRDALVDAEIIEHETMDDIRALRRISRRNRKAIKQLRDSVTTSENRTDETIDHMIDALERITEILGRIEMKM